MTAEERRIARNGAQWRELQDKAPTDEYASDDGEAYPGDFWPGKYIREAGEEDIPDGDFTFACEALIVPMRAVVFHSIPDDERRIEYLNHLINKDRTAGK
ncbi:hypothetical protein Hte_012397 [Hypoxylon texense]